MTTDAWNRQISATWLGDQTARDRVGSKVAEMLRVHGGPGLPVDTFHAELRILGQSGLWYWCTTGIALCGELLLCADHGGTFASYSRNWAPEYEPAVRTIRILRNATCHPAHVRGDRDGPPPRLALAAHMSAKNIAPNADVERLRVHGVELAERWVAEVALKQLGVVARAFCELHLIPLKGGRC
jgi:hypothetical protein